MAQTRLHQYSTNSENINKTEGGGPVVYTGGIPFGRPGLCPHVTAQEPLPPLGTSPFSETVALRMPGILPPAQNHHPAAAAELPFLLWHLKPPQGM